MDPRRHFTLVIWPEQYDNWQALSTAPYNNHHNHHFNNNATHRSLHHNNYKSLHH